MNIYLPILLFWFTTFLIGIFFYPITSIIFPNFIDKGYGLSRVVGLLIVSYIIWILASIKILPFNTLTAIIITLFIFGVIIYKVHKSYTGITNYISTLNWKIIVAEEIIFFVLFLFLTLLRSYNSAIVETEKFTDFGFLNAILRSSYFPPNDMWLSGSTINYYYFGQYMTAFLIRLSQIPSSIGYNLAISFVFAQTGLAILSFALTLTKKIIYSIFSLTSLLFLGNLDLIYQIIKGVNAGKDPFKIFSVYYYASATRISPYTIDEFPLYSSVLGDLHAHFIDLVLQTLVLSLFLQLFLSIKKIRFSFTTFNKEFLSNLKNSNLFYTLLFSVLAIGAMFPSNSWDFLIYASLFFLITFTITLQLLNIEKKSNFIIMIIDLGIVLFLAILYPTFASTIKDSFSKVIYLLIILIFFGILIYYLISTFQSKYLNKKYLSLLGFPLGLIILSIILYLPFYLNFKPPVGGIGINNISHTSWLNFLRLFGFQLFILLVFLTYLILKRARKVVINTKDIFIIMLILTGVILFIAPEFIFLKDIFFYQNLEYFRANTTFKFYYIGWVLFAASSGYIIQQFKSLNINKIAKSEIIIFTIILISCCSLIPLNILFNTNYKVAQTLDGIQYLSINDKGTYDAINWINHNIKGDPVMVEAPGTSFTHDSVISSYTGLPTVMGWEEHEWAWRYSQIEWGNISNRIGDIANLYQANSKAEALSIILKYKIEYIYIGNTETQQYPNLNLSVLESTSKVIYDNNGIKILQVKKA